MVDTRAKGNRIERKAETRLKEKGFETTRMPHTRYGPSDFYNLYDIIAVKPREKIKFIQVKANQKPNLTQLRKDSEDLAPFKHVSVESWCHYDRKGWVLERLDTSNDEWITVVDERQHDCNIGERLKKAL